MRIPLKFLVHGLVLAAVLAAVLVLLSSEPLGSPRESLPQTVPEPVSEQVPAEVKGQEPLFSEAVLRSPDGKEVRVSVPVPRPKRMMAMKVVGNQAETSMRLLLSSRVEGVAVSKEQTDALAKAYADVFYSRQYFELSLAKVEQISERRWQITIPQYEETGTAFRDALRESVCEILGSEVGRNVFEQLSGSLGADNAFWGEYVQVLDLTARDDASGFDLVHNWYADAEEPFKWTKSFVDSNQPCGLYEVTSLIFPPTPGPSTGASQ